MGVVGVGEVLVPWRQGKKRRLEKGERKWSKRRFRKGRVDRGKRSCFVRWEGGGRGKIFLLGMVLDRKTPKEGRENLSKKRKRGIPHPPKMTGNGSTRMTSPDTKGTPHPEKLLKKTNARKTRHSKPQPKKRHMFSST